jgi:ABC-type antimicrobial peptide transport system permease subunit
MGFNKGIIIGMLVVIILFLSVSAMLFSVTTNYGVDVDPEYKDLFDEYEALQRQYEDQQGLVDGLEINPEGQDLAVTKNIIVAAKEAQQSTRLLGRFASKLPSIFGIDPLLIGILITIVLILGMFGFIRFIAKEDP